MLVGYTAGFSILNQKFMSEETYQVTYEPTGRVWTMRPLPKHIYLMFGQMPSSLTETAIEAIQAKDDDALEREVAESLSPEEMLEQAIFGREAVKYCVVKPKISLTPRKGEISPFDISPEEFNFLVKNAIQSVGGQAERLKSFRPQSEQASGSSAVGKPRKKKRK